MPTKRKNGQYVKCFWCSEFPKPSHPYTYTHTNIYSDPPLKNFCTKECLNSWIFRDDHHIIVSLTNLNKQLFINTINKID